jgi:uncharacterized protein (TIGR00290 family)
MGHPTKALLSWSSGKDSAWSLHVLRRQGVEVAGLLTTVNETFGRVAMHAVREVLLERQAEAAGLPLWKVPIPHLCSNEEYERAMTGAMERVRSEGITAIAFGDLFLADIRAYREKRLAGTGIEPLFPIWGLPTDALAREMVAAGLRARITCIDPRQMPRHFAGRVFDGDLLDALPEDVDACGERGEFHTFCYAGPMFRERIEVALGEITERDGFLFADLR